jgi:hypothetical protein
MQTSFDAVSMEHLKSKLLDPLKAGGSGIHFSRDHLANHKCRN